MRKFWSIFWKIFGISLVSAVIAGIIIGFVSHSAGIVYAVLQGTFAAGSGLCGAIGLAVVPVELFFENWTKNGGRECL
ncbi:MAG: hypothetical protein LBU18_04375 [Treponema sp.]|jgi:hypothetical protein|nr:hypothetical protein [Treponema sp.]